MCRLTISHGAALVIVLFAMSSEHNSAYAAVPPDFSVKITDEFGEPIPDIIITLEVPRKFKPPRKMTRKMPHRPRRNQIDKTGKIVKHPPRMRDVLAKFPVPKNADCQRSLRVTVKMLGRLLGEWRVVDWCERKQGEVAFRLAPTPFYARSYGGNDVVDHEERCH